MYLGNFGLENSIGAPKPLPKNICTIPKFVSFFQSSLDAFLRLGLRGANVYIRVNFFKKFRTLKGLSHEMDFKNVEKNLQN